MTPYELPVATASKVRPIGMTLRRLARLWWFGVRTHVAELHGLPRPRGPHPPDAEWPFGRL